MPLPDVLQKQWDAYSRVRPFARTLTMDVTGIVLGKTLLVPIENDDVAIRSRVIALLSVTYNRDIPEAIIGSFQHARRCWKHGDIALAHIHLALTGLHAIDLEQAQRLFVADWAMSSGVSKTQLLKFAGLLCKDDADEDDDGSDDNSGDDSDDDSDGTDFDDKHPRWPAGSPGGIGGEFAPKDSGDATTALHEALSQDAQSDSTNTITQIGAVTPVSYTATQGEDTVMPENSNSGIMPQDSQNVPTQIAGNGDIFENREGLLPKQLNGYYTITVIPTSGISGSGPQRLITGQGGEIYYTPDHYKTFQKLK